MQTIAWDVDDVLNDLMRVWLDLWWVPSNPQPQVRSAARGKNPPHDLVGTTLMEYQSSLDSFRLWVFFRRMEPIADVRSWSHLPRRPVSSHRIDRRPAPLTTGLGGVGDPSLRALIRGFHFVPSLRHGEDLPTYDLTKGEYFRRVAHVDVIIDDNRDHVDDARRSGLKAVLFPRPWNRCKSTVPEALDELAKLAE